MKRTKFYWLLPMLVLVLMIQACGGDQGNAENDGTDTPTEETTEVTDSTQQNETYQQPTELEKKRWKLDKINFQNAEVALVEGSEAFLAFSRGKVSVTGACNRFMGSYEESEGKLTITQLAGTKKACPDTMGQDSKMIRILEAAEAFDIAQSGDYLVIKGSSGSLTYKAVQ